MYQVTIDDFIAFIDSDYDNIIDYLDSVIPEDEECPCTSCQTEEEEGDTAPVLSLSFSGAVKNLNEAIASGDVNNANAWAHVLKTMGELLV